MNKTLMIEVGAGELIDRISILHIKSAQIKDQGKLANVRRELEVIMFSQINLRGLVIIKDYIAF